METTATKATFKKYPAYKDSGVEWLGQVPRNWEVLPLFALTKLKSISNCPDLELLSVYLDLGVIRFSDIDAKRTNATSLDLSKYQKVEPGDFVLNNQQAWRGSVGVSNYEGIVSPAYIILSLSHKLNPSFANYYFRNGAMVSQYLISSKGVGTIQRNLYWPQLRRTYVGIPPKEEQTAIANFLDDKTAKIDQAIAQKEQLIALLKERKQIIIQNAVTKGLDPNVKLKDSGVEWIGEIPEHWEVKKLKYVSKINIDSLPDNTPAACKFEYVDIGSVSFENGIERTESFTFKNSPSRARRIAKEGDTVISTVRTYLKAIDYVTEEKSKFIYSTGFAILTPINIQKAFLYHFVRSNAFTEQVTVDSKGMSYPAINSTDLSRLSLAIPSFEEQSEIVCHIETQSTKIDQAISLQQIQIEKLKEYKATLIESAVTGKIKVF
ncbi:restriction endonuclease subunit S [Xanthomarina gelatinilytica]|uniref:restriction endonuclease subunit S n=1 Tax=Xanthomarina gelatinilytica TaxID=1137281 RepID=UPI003AA8C34B